MHAGVQLLPSAGVLVRGVVNEMRSLSQKTERRNGKICQIQQRPKDAACSAATTPDWGMWQRRRGVPAIRRRQQQRTAQRSCGSSAIGAWWQTIEVFFMMTPWQWCVPDWSAWRSAAPTMRCVSCWAKSCPRRQRWRSWICFRCPRSSGTRAAAWRSTFLTG